ncbi:MAG: TlyA family RNA methyltransferase [Campylobacterota bacterium]|nr:TlyA family RNA methyltransferase [Campylobacterota bacterium]
MRLDIYLTKHNNIQSRNKAQELIKAKKVFVNDKNITKPSFIVEDNSTIKIDEDNFFVSRAAYKLKYFLEDNDIDLSNKTALDIGSSTGGFTQILLLSNVSNVTCVDVGTNQLHETIKDDKKIIVKENTDIREFKSDTKFDIVTCDVSFISILNITDDIDRLSDDQIIILYKPQFEVGRDIKRDSKGVVLDKIAMNICRDEFISKTDSLGWNLIISQQSKVSGKSGNIEELFYFKK